MKESEIYTQLATWLRYQHKDLIWRFDYGAGLKMTMGQAMKMKRIQDDSAYPDFFLAKPVGEYAGLYIEIKHKGFDLYKKRSPSDFINKHIEEQNECLKKLQEVGYYAEFGFGFDECVKIITMYLNDEL